jgi:hypothetical protein
MRFLEYETWRLKKNIDPAAYDKIISDWFKFLKDNYDELFPEWVSAKYYRQTDREGNPTGVFIMVFEYDSLEGHHAYKERRKNWDGPYEAYKKVDPYQEFFDLETVTTDYWQPLNTEEWAQFK